MKFKKLLILMFALTISLVLGGCTKNKVVLSAKDFLKAPGKMVSEYNGDFRQNWKTYNNKYSEIFIRTASTKTENLPEPKKPSAFVEYKELALECDPKDLPTQFANVVWSGPDWEAIKFDCDNASEPSDFFQGSGANIDTEKLISHNLKKGINKITLNVSSVTLNHFLHYNWESEYAIVPYLILKINNKEVERVKLDYHNGIKYIQETELVEVYGKTKNFEGDKDIIEPVYKTIKYPNYRFKITLGSDSNKKWFINKDVKSISLFVTYDFKKAIQLEREHPINEGGNWDGGNHYKFINPGEGLPYFDIMKIIDTPYRIPEYCMKGVEIWKKGYNEVNNTFENTFFNLVPGGFVIWNVDFIGY